MEIKKQINTERLAARTRNYRNKYGSMYPMGIKSITFR